MISSFFAVLALGAAADDVSVERIPALQTLIKPRPAETRWEEIPWQVDVWDARRKAAREGKPIMLWEMDGNPMGCG
ncbi:MAG TPA: hypothetical protein VF950_20345 [Planctomycetota bacterium]